MFGETDGSRKTIGDVDILYHDGLYHLFHLVLPNHDFIAHAVSTNGINWRRVSNAIFIGDPGSWDDLMLWTMHVTPNPHREGQWRMFYTGLSRRDQGHVQRIGLAVSDNLYHWRKVPVFWQVPVRQHDPPRIQQAVAESQRRNGANCLSSEHDSGSCFPLSADSKYYESTTQQGRGVVSFRDPFFYRDQDQSLLLISARIHSGPVVRRGCVAALQEVAPNKFQALPPLHCPGLYDDVEVPNMLKMNDEYYLIGSIREDAKIRYWHTDRVGQPWRSYHDNVLLPQGNYAGRVCRDDQGWLLWNFFSLDLSDRTANNLMLAPKRLRRAEDGLLKATSFEEFDRWTDGTIDTRCVHALKTFPKETYCHVDNRTIELRSDAGFQAFVFDHPLEHFRMRAGLEIKGTGKCGLVFRVDPQTHDGYYLSLDMHKGIAQLRAWVTGAEGSGEHMMQFRSLQTGYWYNKNEHWVDLQLLVFGSFIELTVNGQVLLSLADQSRCEGLLGVYLESAHLILKNTIVEKMRPPQQTDEQLVSG